MFKTFKYRLYPTKAQKIKLERALELCRLLYNAALEQKKTVWHSHKKTLSCYDQDAELPELKRQCPEFDEVNARVLGNVLQRVNLAYQAFFRRLKEKNGKAGFPRFKGQERYDSFTYRGDAFALNKQSLRLSKIGNIKTEFHRPLEGNPKTCIVKREIDQWFAILTCEMPDAESLTPQTFIGVDVGLESFLTTSDGKRVENPQHFRQSEKKLRRLNRAIMRKKKGSKRRRKARIQLAKQHRKIKRQRYDFHHKVARSLVNRYDFIAVENLNVQGMVKNHSLAKSISDAAWQGFLELLSRKAEGAGKRVVRVPAHYTSQICSRCGLLVVKDLSQRWHKCPDCKLSLHRDHNAALNVLRLGLGQSLQASTAAIVAGV